jgi:hypothetical protein
MGVQELDNFRSKYPDYGDMDDATLATKLATKYPDAYSDLPNKVTSSIKPTEDKSLLSKLGDRGSDFLGAFKDLGQQGWNGVTNPARPTLRAMGAGAGAINDIVGSVIEPVGSVIGTGIGKGLEALVGKDRNIAIADTIQKYILDPASKIANPISDAYNRVKQANSETVKDIENYANIIGAAPSIRGAQIVKDTPIGNAVTGSVKNFVKPTPTAEEALGQILQGKSSTLTKDYLKGEKALAAVDTQGVKTYADLHAKLNDAIPKYSKMVDDALAKDPKLYTLDELSTNMGGVSQNYVEKALTNLQELYTKIEDPVKAKYAQDMLELAKTDGLSKVEINNISRQYNVDFGSKAFNKMGEPLTSVNAQGYENIRKGLKDTARQGLDDTAKGLDDTLSSIYNTKRLVDKNVEAVNKLKQKIDERGLGARLVGQAIDAVDYLTLGTVKGAAAKLLPRGFGMKIKNSLDLEESLARNLKIVNKAISSKSDEEMITILKQSSSNNAINDALVKKENSYR